MVIRKRAPFVLSASCFKETRCKVSEKEAALETLKKDFQRLKDESLRQVGVNCGGFFLWNMSIHLSSKHFTNGDNPRNMDTQSSQYLKSRYILKTIILGICVRFRCLYVFLGAA